ncbi:hypothetical protein L5515_012202 [Caenorhabditis briggsae]|uniref:K Homology domain-containing protein n=1 Tax=Caenorhabditis briggsae TaxID=6238 RepID=A0AAE9EZM3_CAEBR|nr:hypothetical protein L5515_012202 [Caenorhabditis briggsae]
MSDANPKSAELSSALQDHDNCPKCCCSRSKPSSKRSHNDTPTRGTMAHLIAFDHLIPFEMDLHNEENPDYEEKRLRAFSTFYHFGAKLYECLRTVAVLMEEDGDSMPVAEVLRHLGHEHLLSADIQYPPVAHIIDVIEERCLDDTQVLFKISDLLEDHKLEKPEDFLPYSPDPQKIPVDVAADTVTAVASMCYHFLATSFSEEVMRMSSPETARDPIPLENAEPESKPNYRHKPPVVSLELQQNAMLLLATRLGIEQFLILSKECGKLQFEGNHLSRITPLMEAAASSSEMIVELLLDYGMDPNAQSVPNCNTALIYAAATDDRDMVEVILEHEGPHKVDVYLINNYYRDAIMEAAIGESLDTLSLFLEMGYEPKTLKEADETKNDNSPLIFAAMKGFLDIATVILDYQDKNQQKTEEQTREIAEERYCALMEAAMEGEIAACKLLILRGTPTEGFKSNLPSPMMLACAGGFPELVEILLAAGARIDETGPHKNTCLIEACDGVSGDQVSVVRMLLNRHADVNAMNPESGDTPMSLAARHGNIAIMKMLYEKGADLTTGKITPIVEASIETHLECVQFILAHCKTIPQEQLSRALFAAAEGGCLKIVEELVRAGADLNFEQDERTAIMKAARFNHFDIVQYLVYKGASVNFKSAKNDATALSLACTYGNMDIAQFLIRNGADPMLRMDDGVNCFMEAAKHGSFDLMKLLVEFTKGNMDLDKSPPKLGINRCKTNKKKKKSQLRFQSSQILAMLNGKPSSERPFSSTEADMFSHLLKCQQQMVEINIDQSSDIITDPTDVEFLQKAVEGIQEAYGFTPEGQINFPRKPSKADMDSLYQGLLVPNIKMWAETIAHGWMTMERKVGRPIEFNSFRISPEVQIENALSAIQALTAVASGLDNPAYLKSVFNKMNNGEEIPRVPATVGSMNAASAALTGIGIHPDDALRLFAGNTFAKRANPDDCVHEQYVAVHYMQEGPFRAALLKLDSMYRERKGAAISVQNMVSNFPIDAHQSNPPPAQQTGPKTTSLTTPQPDESNGATTIEHPTTPQIVFKSGGDKTMEALDPMKVYPGVLKLAADMERLYRANQTDVSREIAVTTAYIASTLPEKYSQEFNVESGDRILKRLLSGMSEKQRAAVMTRVKSTINSESGTNLLQRSVGTLSDKRLKEEYIKLFRETADTAFYEKSNRDKGSQQLKAAEQKKGKTSAANVGSQISAAGKLLMGKPANNTQVQQQQGQQQQGQLRRTHSEGDGTERAKARSNAIDKATDSTLETPLSIACSNGHREVVELLLKEGANIEHRDKKGFTPLIIAATYGHAPIVEVLLKNHAAIEAQSDRTKDTALSLACTAGRKDVVEMLLAHGANKEHRNVSDYTPLSLASSSGFLDIVNLLLTAGSEINSRTGSKLGISPLMLAAMNGHKETTKVLLEKGSDINAQIETNRNTALTLASFQGRFEVVKLLLCYNANVEHRAKTGLTPLMECASGGYVDVGNLLIENGADPNASPVQSTKDTALTIAAEKGHEKFVQMLLDNDVIYDIRNKKGCSALWLACNGGHLGTAQALVFKGADTDMFDNRKMSPMVAAFRKGHIEIIKFLVGHAKQFPNETDLVRMQSTLECADLVARCGECIIIIRNAKKAQAETAEETANRLLQLIDDEKERDINKKQKIKDKKKQKKEAKKKFQAEQEQLSAPPSKPEPVVAPEPEPEPEPEPVEEPAFEPTPPPVEEPPKEPPKPRRNRRKTNPDGVPKGSKPAAEQAVKPPPPPVAEEEPEPAELPYRPIVVKIPSPATVQAPMMSPGSYSESEDWQKAGKEGKKVRPKREGRGTAPSSAGSSQAKHRSNTSSISERQHSWEVDTKGVKAYEFTVPGKIVSRVIGKSGSNINAVREATLAQIEIDKLCGSKEDDRHITVRGSADVVSMAVNIIHLLIYDKDVLIHDAIRTATHGNVSVASSLSSEGTSKSAVDSTHSIPHSLSSASIARQSSPVPVPSQCNRSSKSHGNQATKDGANVWQQRMAARGETPPTQTQTKQQPTPSPQVQQPARQTASPAVRQSLAQSSVPQATENVTKPTQTPPASVQQPIDRVIAPPARREPAQVVQPVPPVHQHTPVPQQRPQETAQPPRFPDPISRPAVSLHQHMQQIQQQPTFSKAPGTRLSNEFSRAPGPPVQPQTPPQSLPSRNDVFEDRLPFTAFKPTAPAPAPVTSIAPSTSTATSTASNGATLDDFDISKLRMYEDSRVQSIWGTDRTNGEEDTWGGLFTNLLQPNSTASSLNTATTRNDTSDWGSNDFMSQLLAGTSNQGTSSAPQQPVSSVNSQLSALETKGWMPSTATPPTARDPVQRQVPLFARSQSSNPSTLQHQQQQQRIMQDPHQSHLHQVMQQQHHSRIPQQFQQPQFSSQSHPSQSSMMPSTQQQLLSQLQAMNLGQQGSNPYDMLAHQLSMHRQENSSSVPGPSQPSANSYYSPSYTDSSVLGQLNMNTLSQRGIKQFDGFNNDQSQSSDGVIAALFNEQQQQKKNQQAGYMQQGQQSFGSTQRIGMMQPAPPPFVPQQAPGAPPGFGDLNRSASGSSQNRPMYPGYGAQQPQPFSQLTQADWDQRLLLQQQQQQRSSQQQQNPTNQGLPQKWSNTWNSSSRM